MNQVTQLQNQLTALRGSYDGLTELGRYELDELDDAITRVQSNLTRLRVRRGILAAEASERCWLRLSDAIMRESMEDGFHHDDAVAFAGYAFSRAMRARDRHLALRDDFSYGRLG